MARQIVLLRGINLAGRNRIVMADLRQLLAGAGFDDVRTYLQSGNVVLSSDASPEQVALECEREVAQGLGLDIRVVVRTREDLAEVVARNPLGHVAVDPRRYQVSFLSGEPEPEVARLLAVAAVPPEQLVVVGREIYAWHPNGIGRSKLWALLSGPALGVTATARNWATVTKLLALSGETR